MSTNNQIGIWGYEASKKKPSEKKEEEVIVIQPQGSVKRGQRSKPVAQVIAEPVETKKRGRKSTARSLATEEKEKTMSGIWGLETDRFRDPVSAPPKAEQAPAVAEDTAEVMTTPIEKMLDIERYETLKSLLKKATKKYKKAKKAVKKAKKDGKNLEKILVMRLKAKLAKKERNAIKQELILSKLRKES